MQDVIVAGAWEIRGSTLVTVGRGREMDVGRLHRHMVISVKGGTGRL